MILVICVHLLVLTTLLWTISKKGLEGALPLAVCFIVIFPEEAKLPLGIFELTVQRLVTLIILAASCMTKGNQDGPRTLPLKSGLIFVGLWWTIATADSINVMASIKALLSLFLDYFTVYVVFARRISDEKTPGKLLGGAVDGLIIVSIFGMLEAYKQWSVVSLFPAMVHRFSESGALYMDDARGLRIQSTFGHPILLGSALAMGIPMTLHLLTGMQSRGRRLWLWFGLMLMFICIFKASSRGPWIALLASLFLCFLFGQRRMRKYVLTLTLIATLAMVIRPGVWQTLKDDYSATVDDHSSQGQSYIYRYELYRLVIEKVGQDPTRFLWGYGPQSFPDLHLVGTIDGRSMRFVSCDSSFAALLAETGYPGLLSMGFLLFYPLLFAFRTYRRLEGTNQQLCLILFTNMFTFLFQMTNVAILGWGQQTILLWVVIAMTMTFPAICSRQTEQNEAEELVHAWEGEHVINHIDVVTGV